MIPLWGESMSQWWLPSQKMSNVELWHFLCCLLEWAVEFSCFETPWNPYVTEMLTHLPQGGKFDFFLPLKMYVIDGKWTVDHVMVLWRQATHLITWSDYLIWCQTGSVTTCGITWASVCLIPPGLILIIQDWQVWNQLLCAGQYFNCLEHELRIPFSHSC